MGFKDSHKKRAAGVQSFLSSNKLFVVIALVAAIIIGTGLIKGNTVEVPASETEQTEEATAPHWRFYPSDLVVLLVGGGFCTIMIIRERRKAKEGLN